MSNSPLVSYTHLSPNYSVGRKYPITKITPHYMGGDCTVEVLGEVFAPTSRQASSNYGIGSDGRIGMYVEEDNRAWTSGNSDNDNRAITIEVANLSDSSITDAAWNSLVNLCVDICKRNGIKQLNWTGDTSGNLTVHRWFQATDCPGEWLMANMPRLAEEVNAQLHPENGTWIYSSGKWWYKHSDGSYTTNGWEYIDNEWYYFDQDGWMRTGWIYYKDKWYWCYPSAVPGHPAGSMAYSTLIQDNDRIYYLQADGVMAQNQNVKVTADINGAIFV